jgi:hypothetical protein
MITSMTGNHHHQMEFTAEYYGRRDNTSKRRYGSTGRDTVWADESCSLNTLDLDDTLTKSSSVRTAASYDSGSSQSQKIYI